MVALPQRIHGCETNNNDPAEQGVGGAPADLIDEVLHGWDNREAADAGAADGQTDGYPAIAPEPLRHQRRVRHKASEVEPLANEQAPGEAELPGGVGIRAGDQAQAEAGGANGKEPARPIAVKQPPGQPRRGRIAHQGKREGQGGGGAAPIVFAHQSRKEHPGRNKGADDEHHGDEG